MPIQSFLINDQVNVVELYFCPEPIQPNALKFKYGWDELPSIPIHLFKNRLDQEVTEYCQRDLIYSYDRSNDAQRTYQKIWMTDCMDQHLYTVAFQEESHPTHRFPCTTEINEKRNIHKIHYKINNRMFFMIEKEDDQWTLYMRYNHASNVELDKMNEEWNQMIQKISKSIYRKH